MLKIRTAILFCLGLLTSVSSLSLAQSTAKTGPKNDPDRQQFTMTIRLTEMQRNQLRMQGNLTIPVPSQIIGSVAAIKLQGKPTFLDEVAKIEPVDHRLGQTLFLSVDESVVDRIEFQPILMKIYHSAFQKIVLNYRPTLGMVPAVAKPDNVEQKESRLFYVRLDSERAAMAQILDFDSMFVETEFGKIDIPSHEIDGLKFNLNDRSEDVWISLRGGDSFRGKIGFEAMRIRTRWAEIDLLVSEVDSITTNSQFVFAKSDDSKWDLIVPNWPNGAIPIINRFDNPFVANQPIPIPLENTRVLQESTNGNYLGNSTWGSFPLTQ
ncbi:MAG: hypothetical protein AAF623_07520 [Planctomycetota bacterium]